LRGGEVIDDGCAESESPSLGRPGCYSWWVGGAFSLLEAIGVGRHDHGRKEEQSAFESAGEAEQGTEGWDGVDGT
jgi:hypothetical protein